MLESCLKRLIYLILFGFISLCQAGVYDDFFTAVLRDDARTVIRLLQRGFDVNSPGPDGQVALATALRLEHDHVIEALLRAPALNVDQANLYGETPLMYVALKGRLDWAQRLVRRGAAVRKPGWTPLHYAATGPEPRMVTFLLDAGADIDALSPQGTTALMLAARHGDERTVSLLLERGADPALTNPEGAIAADYARVAGRGRLAARLEALGRKPVSPALPPTETPK
jgi:ankyrin repeat protein